MRPVYDALYDLMDARIVERALQTGEIEIAPLAFMRGRTLSNSVVILDEAQNTTVDQMKMFLTRLGYDSKAVITGDVTQVDLPNGRQSGLRDAMKLLENVEGIAMCRFSDVDVVRHPLVQRIIRAYDRRDERRRAQQSGEDHDEPRSERRESPVYARDQRDERDEVEQTSYEDADDGYDEAIEHED